jgi:2'-5' RNA ligase
MPDLNDASMIALLPQFDDWCNEDLPHTTLVYLGKIKDLDPILKEELVKIVSSLSILTRSFLVKITSQEVFGSEEKVEVFVLQKTPELSSLRNILDYWDDSEFPIFKPHATIGPKGTIVKDPPLYITFDRIALVWGEERIIFRLQRY